MCLDANQTAELIEQFPAALPYPSDQFNAEYTASYLLGGNTSRIRTASQVSSNFLLIPPCTEFHVNDQQTKLVPVTDPAGIDKHPESQDAALCRQRPPSSGLTMAQVLWDTGETSC